MVSDCRISHWSIASRYVTRWSLTGHLLVSQYTTQWSDAAVRCTLAVRSVNVMPLIDNSLSRDVVLRDAAGWQFPPRIRHHHVRIRGELLICIFIVEKYIESIEEDIRRWSERQRVSERKRKYRRVYFMFRLWYSIGNVNIYLYLLLLSNNDIIRRRNLLKKFTLHTFIMKSNELIS